MCPNDQTNKGGENWYVIGTMAKDIRLSHSTIKRDLAEVIRQARMKKTRFLENGDCSSNQYTV